MDSLMSDGSEYLNSKEFKELAAQIGATSVDDVLRFLNGKSTQSAVQGAIGKGLDTATFGKFSKPIGRFAGSGPMRTVARIVPGLSVATTALGAADIVAGNDSLVNKAMDTAAMGIGGVAGGMLGGPLGAATGASIGKMASDATQFVLGGGQSAEQRRLEEALVALQRGGMI